MVIGGIQPWARASLEFYNLPDGFREKLGRRARIDHYQFEHYTTETNLETVAYPVVPKRQQERKGTIRVLHSSLNESAGKSGAALKQMFVPSRGYRAPVLGRTNDNWAGSAASDQTNLPLQARLKWVEEHLAFDGLLPTVATVVFRFGDGNSGLSPMSRLQRAGLPMDWLKYFMMPMPEGSAAKGDQILEWILARKQSGQSLETVCAALSKARLEFQPSLRGYQLTVEDGTLPLQLLRIQIGGGYQGGIVPGGSLDFAGKLIEAMPDAKVILSVEEEHFGICHMLAARCWPLQRAGQLTLIGEPLPVSAWAQDNGKPGSVRGSAGGPGRAAAMIPRFASRGDGESVFVPGDSFLMEGVKATGLEVAQSPLLFQGGDLMAVLDPRTKRRVLFLGEGEVHRNRSLGLTAEQVLEVFRLEMGVDECVVWPEGSFHLDYDVSFRRIGEQLLAFVNDPADAARIIAGKGFTALEAGNFVSAERVRLARAGLETRDYQPLFKLAKVLGERGRNATGAYKTELVRRFAEEPVDSATANFQCFLTAIDFLLATAPEYQAFAETAERADYLQSLRELGASLKEQRELLEARHWQVVSVPSMPDLNRSVNYLNGLQDKRSYVMPVWGGFYRELDAAATAAFQAGLGPEVRIVPIQCAHSQTHHGSIHCMVKAYTE
ncbi:MAG: hypothetical protein JWM16_1759 [Verrucomicrobiales bacterium]|nr:hypothetical protein [Verrucomicrobiales bacterium]